MPFGKIGIMELVLILVIALVIFGPSKLPGLGKSLGQTISEFKSASKDITNDTDDESKKSEQ